MTTLLAAIIVLGVLIFVHELGHFVAAKATGTGVTRFSLGFPPRLIGIKLGGTDYCIGLIPLGGYVKMIGEAPDEEVSPEDLPRSFSHKSIWRRIVIVVAGPAANFLFAVVLFFLTATVFGMPAYDTTLGIIEPGTPAYQAGLRFKDRVVAVDDRPVRTWYDVNASLEAAAGKPVRVTFRRGPQGDQPRTMTMTVQPDRSGVSRPSGQKAGATQAARPDPWRGMFPFIPPRVGIISTGKPADRANIKVNDLILAVNGHPVRQFSDVVPLVREHYRLLAGWQNFLLGSLGYPLRLDLEHGRWPLQLTLKRGRRVIGVSLVPEKTAMLRPGGRIENPYIIGINSPDPPLRRRLGIIDGAWHAVERTGAMMVVIVRVVGGLISGQVSLSQMAGPVGITQQAGRMAKSGAVPLIVFAAFLSINLGILNLLPIPMFDGGHVMFFVIEAVRRRPVSLKARQVAQQFGLAFIILLMAFVFSNDIIRILR
jgi:regulator of sigma E protease